MSKAFEDHFQKSSSFNSSRPVERRIAIDSWNAAIAHAVKVLREEAGYHQGRSDTIKEALAVALEQQAAETLKRVAERLERGE